MQRSGAARRYAKALLQLAEQQGSIDAWRSELEDVASVMVDSGIAGVLADTNIPRERRYAMLERVLDVDPLVLNYARLLVDKSRTREAGHIAEEYQHLANQLQDIATVEIVTAIELSDDEAARVIEQLQASTGKQVRAHRRIDPGIIGGLVVRIEDRIYDGSVRSRLRDLQRHLSGVS